MTAESSDGTQHGAEPPGQHGESERLARLAELQILDTEAEPFFDALAAAAQAIAGTPVALVTLVDRDRLWFKANRGLPGVDATPREHAFCAQTIQTDQVLEVADVAADPRFRAGPDVHYYAGAPIVLPGGERMGSVCVIDRRTRKLDTRQLEALMHLAKLAACGLEQRRQALTRERRAAELEQRLRDSEAFLERTGRVAGVGGWEVDVEEGEIIWSDQTCRIHDLPPGYRPSMQQAVGYYPPKARAVITGAVEESMRSGAPWDLELPLFTSTGRAIWVHTVGALEQVDGRRRLIGALQDITERRQAVDAVAASERKYRKLFQDSLGLICTHDLEGRLLSINPAAARSLGHAVEALEGRSLTELMRPERREFFKAYLSQMVLDGSASGMVEVKARDGSFCHWQYRNVLDVETDVPYVLVHAQDVSVQYQQAKQLLKWSFTDPLTSCYNRRFLQDLERQPDSPVHWGCMVVDLDKFKQVNDTYGHQRGDEVLVGMAWFLNSKLRRQDRLVRLGGDEFLMLVHEATLDDLHALAQAYEAEADEAPIAFTLGVAAAEPGEPLPETLRRADKALYALRRERRGHDVSTR